jgi:hypothetical protein
MNKKIFCISAFLILVLILSGCTGGKPTLPEMPTDEELIRGVIDDFFSAFGDMKWALARGYCVEGTEFYNAVVAEEEEIEDKASTCNELILNFSFDVSEVDIDGDESQVYGYMTNIRTCDEDVEDNSDDATISLQKIDGSWKISDIG